MSAALTPEAPIGTTVWVEVGKGISLAGKTIERPYHLPYGGGFWRVEVEIGDNEHDFPLTRIQRRKAKR